MANPITAATTRTVSDFLASLRHSSPRRRRKVKLRRKERTLRRYCWDANDNMFNLEKIMNESDNQKIFLGCSDFDDLIISELLKRRFDASQKTVHRQTTVLCNREHWAVWAEKNYENYLYIQPNSSSGIIIQNETNNYIR